MSVIVSINDDVIIMVPLMWWVWIIHRLWTAVENGKFLQCNKTPLNKAAVGHWGDICKLRACIVDSQIGRINSCTTSLPVNIIRATIIYMAQTLYY